MTHLLHMNNVYIYSPPPKKKTTIFYKEQKKWGKTVFGLLGTYLFYCVYGVGYSKWDRSILKE